MSVKQRATEFYKTIEENRNKNKMKEDTITPREKKERIDMIIDKA